MTKVEKVRKAEELINTNPTEGQKQSGNYKKGKVTIKGFKITIENAKDSIRSGIDSNGNEWKNKLPYAYGYFNSTVGKDGDHLDVYLGENLDDDFDIYVIDQVEKESRAFDEHKVMFGFLTKEEAKQAYLDCYDKDWTGFYKISRFSINKFKKWIKNKDMLKYPASKLNLSSRIDFKNVMRDETKIIRLSGEVLEGKTLKSLQTQAGDLTKVSELVLEIASPGGSVSEGLEIMVWLDHLSSIGIKVISIVVANSYSIASLIMLVADIRLISKHGKVMVHNPMIPELQYVNANELEKEVKSLRELESYMYDLYQVFTGLDREIIKELMDNETYLSPKEAVDYNFADMVIDIKSRPYEMAMNTKKEVNMSKTLNILNKVIGMVNQSDVVNQLYYDTEGGEIEIYQGDSSVYKVGDKTSVKEGKVKLSDGCLLVIEDNTITEIDKSLMADETEDPAGEPAVIPDADLPATDTEDNFNTGPAPVADPEGMDPGVKSKDDMPGKVIEKTESVTTTKETVATSITRVSKWESEVVEDSFDLGTKVHYKPYEEGDDPKPVDAGEYELEDGRKILIDADGVIQFIKPKADIEAMDPAKEEEMTTPGAEAVVDAPAVEPPVKMIDEDMENKKYDALVAKYDDLANKYEDVVSRLSAMETHKEEMIKKVENSGKFEALATEAIETLAKTTTSSFKPAAKAKVGNAPQGSIFHRLKKERGLA